MSCCSRTDAVKVLHICGNSCTNPLVPCTLWRFEGVHVVISDAGGDRAGGKEWLVHDVRNLLAHLFTHPFTFRCACTPVLAAYLTGTLR